MIGWEVAVLVGVLCLLVEGFFAGSEIAVVSSDRSRIRHKAAQGDRGAIMVEKLLLHPQNLLATTLIGTNLATIAFSVTVALALLGTEASSSELLVIAIVSPCTLLIGEVIPKTLCQHYADSLVTRIVYPLRVASVIVRPFAWSMGLFAGMMTRLLGTDRERAFVTRDELVLLIEAESAESSEITEDEREMISNLLEMSDRTVDDVMVPLSEVVALPEDATVAEAALEVADKQHTRIPIYRLRVDDIVGVVHAFDILQRTPDARSLQVSEIARPPTFVPESKPAGDLLVELQGTGNQMAIVVDEYGGARGIVSVEDLIEEIVGEIEDEYDHGPSPLRREAPGVWKVEARTTVERINEELEIELPIDDDEYESIGGLMLAHLKRIPHEGETLNLRGVLLTVVRATDRSVDTVRIELKKR